LKRQKLVEAAYQKGNELTLTNSWYRNWVKAFFEREYSEDVDTGDLTAEAVVTKNLSGAAILKTKMPGVIAGVEEAAWFLKMHGLNIKLFKKDGEEVKVDETIFEVHGKQKTILATERIALNVLQRMSGITTETRRLSAILEGYSTRVAATRKTVLRYLDKKAVFIGGGLTHRFGLWDSILIKDNHLASLKHEGAKDYLDTALERAAAYSDKARFIEIEVTCHEEAIAAARSFSKLGLKVPCIVMFDNLTPSEIEYTIETLRGKGLYDSVLLEASGAIKPEKIRDYAKTGVDVISMGYLTHSSQTLDMSLEMTF